MIAAYIAFGLFCAYAVSWLFSTGGDDAADE